MYIKGSDTTPTFHVGEVLLCTLGGVIPFFLRGVTICTLREGDTISFRIVILLPPGILCKVSTTMHIRWYETTLCGGSNVMHIERSDTFPFKRLL